MQHHSAVHSIAVTTGTAVLTNSSMHTGTTAACMHACIERTAALAAALLLTALSNKLIYQ
eukprot:5297-Heterococcus_DN1.PRE.1